MGKICILLPTHWDAGKGGAEYQADLFSKYLKQTTKHDVIYLARDVSNVKKHDAYNIHKIPTFIKSQRFGLFVDSITLYKKLIDLNPDVIWQRVGCAYTGIAAYYCKRKKKSLIWHIASDDDVKEKKISSSLKKAPSTIDSLFLKYGIRNATRIIAQTKSQAKMLNDNYHRSVDEIIPNFLPIENVVKQKKKKKPQCLSVVWISNMKKLKQPELFIKLASDCIDHHNISFVMIGRKENSEWCHNLLKEAEKIRNLEYLGEMNIEGVNGELGNSDLLVNTSLYEGLPNTFIQAWMREVPTLTLNIDPDGVIQRYNIGLCAGNYENMKRYVINMCENIDELREAGERARRVAEKSYSMKNANRLIEQIDRELNLAHVTSL